MCECRKSSTSNEAMKSISLRLSLDLNFLAICGRLLVWLSWEGEASAWIGRHHIRAFQWRRCKDDTTRSANVSSSSFRLGLAFALAMHSFARWCASAKLVSTTGSMANSILIRENPRSNGTSCWCWLVTARNFVEPTTNQLCIRSLCMKTPLIGDSKLTNFIKMFHVFDQIFILFVFSHV